MEYDPFEERDEHTTVCEHEVPRVLDMQWDSYFCPDCLQWLESVCSNEECTICTSRPPFAHLDLDEGC